MENIDQVLLQESLSIAHLKALTQMVLGVYKDTLDADDYNRVKGSFYDLLERGQVQAIRGLHGIIDDKAYLVWQEFEVISEIQKLRQE